MDITRLSPSGLRLLQMCGEAFRRRYVEGERTSFGPPVVIGNATHSSAEVDLTLKRDEGELMVDEAVRRCQAQPQTLSRLLGLIPRLS